MTRQRIEAGGFMPNIATLGFDFDSSAAGKQIDELIKKFDQLSEKGKKSPAGLTEVFNKEIAGAIIDSGDKLKNFNAKLAVTQRRLSTIGNSVKLLRKHLAEMAAIKVEPVSAKAVENANNLANALNKAKDNATAIPKTPKITIDTGGGKAPKDGKSKSEAKDALTLNKQLHHMYFTSNDVTMAFNTLKSTISGSFFVKAARSAREFNQELDQIRLIAHDVDTTAVEKGILSLPSVLGDSKKITRSMYEAYSSGITGTEAEMTKFTSEVAGLAKIMRSGVKEAMDATVVTMNTFGLSTGEASKAMDTLFNIVKYGRANGRELGNTWGLVASTAKTAGLSLDETGAAIASLTKTMRTSTAVTSFNNMLQKLIKPTEKARKAAAEMGIDLSLSAIRAKGFNNVIKEIYDKSRGNEDVLLKIFSNDRGVRAALQVFGAGWKDFQTQLENFKNGAGAANAEVNNLMKSSAEQMAALPVTFEKIRIAAGESATSILTFGGLLTPLIRSFNEMGTAGQKGFGALTNVVAGFGIYKAVLLTISSLSVMQQRNQASMIAMRLNEISSVDAASAAWRKYGENLTVVNQAALNQALSGESTFNLPDDRKLADKLEYLKLSTAQSIEYKKALMQEAYQSGETATADALRAAVGKDLNKILQLNNIENKYKLTAEKAYQKMASTNTVLTRALGRAQLGLAVGYKAVRLAAISAGAAIRGFIAANAPLLIISLAVSGITYLWEKMKTKAAEAAEKQKQALEEIANSSAKANEEYKELFNLIDTQYSKHSSALAQIGRFGGIAGNSSELKRQADTLNAAIGKRLFYYDEESKKLKASTDAAVQLAKARKAAEEAADRKFMFNANWDLSQAEAEYRAIKKEYDISKELLKKAAEEDLRPQRGSSLARLNEIYEKVAELEAQLALQEQKINKYREVKQKALATLVEEQEKRKQKQLKESFVVNSKLAEAQAQADYKKMSDLQKIKHLQQEISKVELQTVQHRAAGQHTEANKLEIERLKLVEQRVALEKKAAEEIAAMQGKLFDFDVKYAKSDAERLKLLQDKMNELYKQANLSVGKGDISGGRKLFEQALGLDNQTLTIQQRLANAEKKANDELVKLVISMDKFKESTAQAVNANSIEALKLQSRRFDTLPQLPAMQNNQQTILQNQIDRMRQMQDAFIQAAQAQLNQVKQLLGANDNKQLSLELQKQTQNDNKNASTLVAAIKDASLQISRSVKNPASGISAENLVSIG